MRTRGAEEQGHLTGLQVEADIVEDGDGLGSLLGDEAPHGIGDDGEHAPVVPGGRQGGHAVGEVVHSDEDGLEVGVVDLARLLDPVAKQVVTVLDLQLRLITKLLERDTTRTTPKR